MKEKPCSIQQTVELSEEIERTTAMSGNHNCVDIGHLNNTALGTVSICFSILPLSLRAWVRRFKHSFMNIYKQ